MLISNSLLIVAVAVAVAALAVAAAAAHVVAVVQAQVVLVVRLLTMIITEAVAQQQCRQSFLDIRGLRSISAPGSKDWLLQGIRTAYEADPTDATMKHKTTCTWELASAVLRLA